MEEEQEHTKTWTRKMQIKRMKRREEKGRGREKEVTLMSFSELIKLYKEQGQNCTPATMPNSKSVLTPQVIFISINE